MDASQYLRRLREKQTLYLARAAPVRAGDYVTRVAAEVTASHFVATNAVRGTDANQCCRVFPGHGGGAVTPVAPLAACGGACETPSGFIVRPGCGC